MPTEGGVGARLYGSNGQLLVEKAYLLPSEALDLSPYPAGVYYLRLSDQQGRQQTFKVMKVEL
ncbi:MAG: T9SS C-terminal target domain-containing protein [Bacteroidetes bacterium]|nr:MAG: T9SS C-terminal target domain-containing protein [Bacteroidota bacterium]